MISKKKTQKIKINRRKLHENLVLGLSLAANVALGYLIFQDKSKLSTINERIDSLSDQVSGKVKQVKGAITGDPSDKIGGNLEEGKGQLKESVTDLKENLSAKLE